VNLSGASLDPNTKKTHKKKKKNTNAKKKKKKHKQKKNKKTTPSNKMKRERGMETRDLSAFGGERQSVRKKKRAKSCTHRNTAKLISFGFIFFLPTYLEGSTNVH